MKYFQQEIATIYLKNSRYNNFKVPGILHPSQAPRVSNPNDSSLAHSFMSNQNSVFEPVCLKDVGNLTQQPFDSPLDAAARASLLK